MKPEKKHCLKDLDEPNCKTCDVIGCIYHDRYSYWVIDRKKKIPLPHAQSLGIAANVIEEVNDTSKLDPKMSAYIGKISALLHHRIRLIKDFVPTLDKGDGSNNEPLVKFEGTELHMFGIPPYLSLLYYICETFQYLTEEIEDKLGNGEFTLLTFAARNYFDEDKYRTDCQEAFETACIINSVFDDHENDRNNESEDDKE